EGDPGRHRAIADDRHGAASAAREVGGDGHAERRADGGARVTDAEGVVGALLALRERRQALPLADGVQAFLAAGQDLVRVGLVADVPDDTILGRVVEVVERDGELDRTESGREVSSRATDRIQQESAYLGGQ